MAIRIDGTNTAANPGITGADADTGLQFGTDEVSIVTGGTERVKINSAGSIEATSAADVRLTLGSSGTAGTNDSVHIRGDGPNLLFMNGAGGITRFEQNGTEELRIQSGGGISFNGDTAAANALDDYEEGIWTPTIDIGGLTTGITYSQQDGIYTKIGDVVTVGCRILLSNKGTATGSVRIDGLPFAANIPGGPVNAGVLVNEFNNTSWPQSTSYGLAWLDGYVYLRWNSATVWAAITDSNLTNGSQFYWSSTFKVS